MIKIATDREELKRRIKERLGEGKPKTKRKTRVKSAAKVTAICACFAVALIVALAGIRLIPGYDAMPALLSIGAPLVIAWLVTAGVGQNIIATKRALALATACLVVAAPIAWYGPWRPSGEGVRPGEGEGGGPPVQAGGVLFKYEANVTYLGSADNLSLMGYLVAFPCPTVDGEPAIKQENLRWQLWGPVEGENGAKWMELEVDNNNIFQWVGERANSPPDNDFYWSPLGMPFMLVHHWTEFGVTWKIDIQNSFDNLYPREMIKSIGYFSLPAADADRVTLEEDNETVRQLRGEVITNAAFNFLEGVEPITIDLSFQVKLSKKVGNSWVTVKNYIATAENRRSWGDIFLELEETA